MNLPDMSHHVTEISRMSISRHNRFTCFQAQVDKTVEVGLAKMMKYVARAGLSLLVSPNLTSFRETILFYFIIIILVREEGLVKVMNNNNKTTHCLPDIFEGNECKEVACD